ncbi:helix-turn-helix domain-containing protein [Mangrovibacillus cuniculi]|uniref:Helix-turn-helix transcriptional regulator n=1 Tax=Mangrovibacillus cuniculi TaxID=2593652 RepID=A0A7S8CCW9_9BACI|nr:helix-turn-helix transcriptional regulator [Mangrovibacillus cuniculi]QPC47671.1 helix-turn-helix transcriptional regulator [Mangrovibacillus cuniculi]
MLFREFIVKYREEVLGLSMTDAAKRLSLSKQALNNYEKGTRDIPFDIAIHIKNLYSIPLDEFMKFVEGDNPLASSTRTLELHDRQVESEFEEAVNLLAEFPELRRYLVDLALKDAKIREKKVGSMLTILKELDRYRG